MSNLLHTLMTALYWLIHWIAPQRILSWIAFKLPYKDDAYVPAGFFVPPPAHLPAGFSYHLPLPSLGKLILERGVWVKGTVVATEPFQPHPSWNHQTFYLKPDDPGLLNNFSGLMVLSWPGTNLTLKCEPEPDMQRLPAPGDRITVLGHFCIDLAHGWTSIIPVSEWMHLS